MVVRQWIEALLEWTKFWGYSWVITMKTIFLQVVSLVLMFLFILWTAAFMYGVFYYSYMPQIAHEKDVHLQFRTNCEEFQRTAQLCSFPSANFSLAKHNQGQFLTRGQSYVVSLELVMPDSPVNQEHGMFMSLMQFYTYYGEPVKASVRSTMLRYKSPLLRLMETIFSLPSLLLGSTEERQVLTTELFEDYQEDPYKPSVGAYIEVQSRRIEIYSAKMRIHARFSGLRYLLYHWPLLSGFIGISVNMFFLCIVAMLSWYQITFKDGNGKLSPSTVAKVSHEEKQKRVRALLERERQKEREAIRREMGLASSSSVPNLHKRAASLGVSPLAQVETVAAAGAGGGEDTDDTRERSFSAVTADAADEGIQIRYRKPAEAEERS